jgi:hypothetical protein
MSRDVGAGVFRRNIADIFSNTGAFVMDTVYFFRLECGMRSESA